LLSKHDKLCDIIVECMTDRQTDGHVAVPITRASIASRG